MKRSVAKIGLFNNHTDFICPRTRCRVGELRDVGAAAQREERVAAVLGSAECSADVRERILNGCKGGKVSITDCVKLSGVVMECEEAGADDVSFLVAAMAAGTGCPSLLCLFVEECPLGSEVLASLGHGVETASVVLNGADNEMAIIPKD